MPTFSRSSAALRLVRFSSEAIFVTRQIKLRPLPTHRMPALAGFCGLRSVIRCTQMKHAQLKLFCARSWGGELTSAARTHGDSEYHRLISFFLVIPVCSRADSAHDSRADQSPKYVGENNNAENRSPALRGGPGALSHSPQTCRVKWSGG